jgi:DNA-binding transcriptional MerR regulator
MTAERSFTLSEIAKRLDVPQHRLIHLCEKGVVLPEVHDAAGRGSSRVFSLRNYLELAVAIRLRDMLLPVATVGAVIHVLRALEKQLQTDASGISLTESLRSKGAPELRVIISDGRQVFFTLGRRGEKPKLFGGIPLDAVNGGRHDWDGHIKLTRPTSAKTREPGVGGPEGSQFARLELSVTAVAQSLSM